MESKPTWPINIVLCIVCTSKLLDKISRNVVVVLSVSMETFYYVGMANSNLGLYFYVEVGNYHKKWVNYHNRYYTLAPLEGITGKLDGIAKEIKLSKVFQIIP